LGLRYGIFRRDEKLEELQNWDSVSLVGLIVLAEASNDSYIFPDQIVSYSIVADLQRLTRVDGAFSAPKRKKARTFSARC
jgi:hypothetical protein